MTFEPRWPTDWKEPSDPDYTWSRAVGPLSAFYQDVEQVYCDHKKICWETVAAPMAKDHILRIFDGWAYIRGPEFDEAAGKRLAAHATIPPERFGDWYVNDLKPQVLAITEPLKKHPRPTRPYDELLAHLDDCIQAFGTVMGDLHWRMAAARIGGPGGGKPIFEWAPKYAEITGRPEAEAALFLGGLTNEMTKTVLALRKLARLVQADPDLQKLVDAGDLGTISSDDRFKTFATRFRSMLRKCGHRTGAGWGSAQWLGAPTWNVAPEIPLQLIGTYARADLDEMDRKEKELVKERKRLERQVRKELAGDPERLARFDAELEQARGTAFFFEDHNDVMDQTTPGLVCDAVHVVGQRLARDGVIDDPKDVVHLHLAELRNPAADARALVEQRRADFERQTDLDPPQKIGKPTDEPDFVMHDEGEGQKGNVLHGIAASSGRYTGRARVFLPSPIPPDVDDGDILIAVDAGPDWTPVFAVLGAVVLDKGAACQHAGVVAREFGIPAVTGTKVGTEAITDGATITVDGDAGTVEMASA